MVEPQLGAPRWIRGTPYARRARVPAGTHSGFALDPILVRPVLHLGGLGATPLPAVPAAAAGPPTVAVLQTLLALPRATLLRPAEMTGGSSPG